MLTVPVLRPEVAREYEEYQAAVDEYNRRRMEEMRKTVPGAPVCMAYAHAAPRCAHVRADGTRCGAPALRQRSICYAHTRMLAVRKSCLKLPVLEDAGGIALAAMQVVQQMLDGKLPRRKAATALYGIQIVAGTLNHRPFAVYPTNVVMEAEGLPPEEELLGPEAVNETNEGLHGAAGRERKRDSNEQSTPLKNVAQEGNSGDHSIAKKKAAQGEDASDQGDREQRSRGTEPAERCGETGLRVPFGDVDSSLGSGFANNQSGDPYLQAPFANR